MDFKDVMRRYIAESKAELQDFTKKGLKSQVFEGYILCLEDIEDWLNAEQEADKRRIDAEGSKANASGDEKK